MAQTAMDQTTRMHGLTLFVGRLTGTSSSRSSNTVKLRVKRCWRHDRDARSGCLHELFNAAAVTVEVWSHPSSPSVVNRTVLEVTDIRDVRNRFLSRVNTLTRDIDIAMLSVCQ